MSRINGIGGIGGVKNQPPHLSNTNTGKEAPKRAVKKSVDFGAVFSKACAAIEKEGKHEHSKRSD